MREKCKNCVRPTKACISYLMTLSTKEMLEWCRIWKEKLGWSNATLAEKSRVPKGTIDRVLSLAKTGGDTSEVKLSTVRPIICALIGCSIEELESCDSANEISFSALMEKNKDLQENLTQLKADSKTQYSFLANQIRIKDRYIAVLAIALVAVIVLAGIFIFS
jgi:hypothetical protein